MLFHSGKLDAIRIGPRMLRVTAEALEAHKARLAGQQPRVDPPIREQEQGVSQGRAFLKMDMSWDVNSKPMNPVVSRMRQIAILQRTMMHVRLEQHRSDLEDGLQADPQRYEKLCEIAGSVMRLDTGYKITVGAYDVVQAHERFRKSKYASEEALSFSTSVRALIEAITDEIGEALP